MNVEITLDRCIAELSILYERMTPKQGVAPERSYTADIDPRAVEAAIELLACHNYVTRNVEEILKGEDNEIRKD